jgi:ribosomal protein S3
MSLLKTNTRDISKMKTIFSSGVEAGMTINKLNVLLGKKNRKIERLKQQLTEATQSIRVLQSCNDYLEGRIDVLSCNVEIPCASPWDC